MMLPVLISSAKEKRNATYKSAISTPGESFTCICYPDCEIGFADLAYVTSFDCNYHTKKK